MHSTEVLDPSQLAQNASQPCSIGPRQWPSSRKIVSVVVVSYADCLTFLVSMMLAPSVPQVLKEFRPNGNDKFLGTLSVTAYVFGFSVGPLLFGPLTDLVGRINILRLTTSLYVIFTIACALSTSLPMLIIFRFIAGCFGGAPMAIGGGVVADLYAPGERSQPMAWYSVGTMMGPTLGPVLGGLINGSLNWRWVFWIAAILGGICFLSLCFLLEETHQATLIRRTASESSTKSIGRKAGSCKAATLNWKSEHVAHTLRHSITILGKIAHHLPALAILFVIGIFTGLVNMILSSLGSVFQFQYHFGPKAAGLAYLGLGLGGVTGLYASPRICDLYGKLRPHQDGSGSKRPQHVLPMLIIAGPVASIGLVWYGWTIQAKTQYMAPIMGLCVFGFGYTSIRLSTQIFLIEAFPNYTASALAAHTISSSIGGTFIPIGTFPLYDYVGYGWGNSVIAFINLGLCVVLLVMYAASLRLTDEWILHVET